MKVAVRKQGEISIEPALDKQQDWAMEFESDGKGAVTYRGLSVFGTAERGAYSGNILGSESFRESFILAQSFIFNFYPGKKGFGNCIIRDIRLSLHRLYRS